MVGDPASKSPPSPPDEHNRRPWWTPYCAEEGKDYLLVEGEELLALVATLNLVSSPAIAADRPSTMVPRSTLSQMQGKMVVVWSLKASP
jgi:hypothetical protein